MLKAFGRLLTLVLYGTLAPFLLIAVWAYVSLNIHAWLGIFTMHAVLFLSTLAVAEILYEKDEKVTSQHAISSEFRSKLQEYIHEMRRKPIP